MSIALIFLFAHFCLLGAWGRRRVPFGALPHGFRAILKNPRFVTSYYSVQKVRVIFTTLHQFSTDRNSIVFFLFFFLFLYLISEHFRNELSAHLPHCEVFRDNPVHNGFQNVERMSDIRRTLIRRSAFSSSSTFLTVSSPRDVEGRPDRCSSATSSRPSLKLLCHFLYCE